MLLVDLAYRLQALLYALVFSVRARQWRRFWMHKEYGAAHGAGYTLDSLLINGNLLENLSCC